MEGGGGGLEGGGRGLNGQEGKEQDGWGVAPGK
jgi:hypothetical protein